MPTKEEIKAMHISAFDEVMQEKLIPIIGQETSLQIKAIVEKLDLQRKVYGHDMTGLSKKMKTDFVEIVKATVFKDFSIDTKANEALIEEQDNRGGYLVSREVADAIMRIAASVGTIMGQAAKWEMTTDELGVPNYTGSFLKGSYLGVDQAGTPTGLTFGQAQLIAK